MLYKKRKYIVAIGCSILFIAIIIGYNQYTKPRQSAANLISSASVNAVLLFKAYQQNEPSANAKYLGKVLAVQGKVIAADKVNGILVVSLYTGNAGGAVNCQMFNNTTDPSIKIGDLISIKGKCTGFLMDVNLVDCIIQ